MSTVSVLEPHGPLRVLALLLCMVPGLATAAIFGDDDRRKLTPEEAVYPVRHALGRLICRHPDTGKKSVGTAAIVDTGTADPDHNVLITAAHVVMDPATGAALNDCRFKAAGRLWGSDPVMGMRHGAFDGRPHTNAADWAVVLIAPQHPAPNRLPLWTGQPKPEAVALLGYRADQRGLWVSDHCFARPPQLDEALYGERVLLSNCDASPGASGAPLLVNVDGQWHWGGLYRGHLYDPKAHPERPERQAAFSGRKAMNVIVQLPRPTDAADPP